MILDFTCEVCGHEFEELVSKKEANELLCPKCNNVVKQNSIQCTNTTKHSSWEVK